MKFEIGSTVGDYEVVDMLGAGGMGKVYKVRNTITGRIEAMKVILPDLASQAGVAERFMREIKALASIDHPHIAGLRTAIKVEDELLMIMEYVEGATLEAKLSVGPIPRRQSVDWICQALSALECAHECGLVHRDIKPANMMITKDGRLKLMDFGVAKAAADQKLTKTGTVVGSVHYVSPEQVSGGAVDARADLYAVGISLYEVLTGVRPFEGDSDFSIMAAHLEAQPRQPIEIDPSLPPALNEAILTAIRKDPKDRYQTAASFRMALERVRQSLAPETGVAAGSAANASRRGWYVALGAAAVLVLLLGGAIYLPSGARSRAEDKPAVTQEIPAPAPAPVQSGEGKTAPPSDTPAPRAPKREEAIMMAQARLPGRSPTAPGSGSPQAVGKTPRSVQPVPIDPASAPPSVSQAEARPIEAEFADAQPGADSRRVQLEGKTVELARYPLALAGAGNIRVEVAPYKAGENDEGAILIIHGIENEWDGKAIHHIQGWGSSSRRAYFTKHNGQNWYTLVLRSLERQEWILSVPGLADRTVYGSDKAAQRTTTLAVYREYMRQHPQK